MKRIAKFEKVSEKQFTEGFTDAFGKNPENEYYEILGNKLLCNTLPVRPGRNIAAICEVAAINSRIRKEGYNAAEVLSQRLMEMHSK